MIKFKGTEQQDIFVNEKLEIRYITASTAIVRGLSGEQEVTHITFMDRSYLIVINTVDEVMKAFKLC